MRFTRTGIYFRNQPIKSAQQQPLFHHHDTIWLPHNETKIVEKKDFRTETRQIEYKTPLFIKKIVIVETIIILLILLFYLAKKHRKR